MPLVPSNATIRRHNSFPFCGRLIALPTSRSLAVGQSLDLEDQISIDFPAMPDSVELARSTDYNIIVNPFLPDGIHQYKGTKPLEIPFSFRLHAYDQDFCPKGAYSLLQLAARLHSFTIPIDGSGGNVAIWGKAGTAEGTSETEVEKRASNAQGDLGFDASKGAEKVVAPVTCRLEMIFTESDSPGIACTGYVREVSVKLNQPWLKGPGKSFNLPSSADFAFTFIHQPGHGNTFNISSTDLDLQPQAYAETVKNQFYNTRSLVQVANYRGFADAPTVSTTAVPAQQTGLTTPSRSVFFR